jgi:hypothetical protein
MQADVIPCGNQMMRYCQQCGALEPLSLFDYTKRSCRDSLSRRIKRPALHAQGIKRKRQNHSQRFSDTTSNSNYWSSQFDWAATNAAAGSAVAGGDASERACDTGFLAAAAVPQPSVCGLTHGDVTAWNSAAAGVMIPNSCWLDVPVAEQPAAAAAAAAAAAYDCRSPAALVSPASSTCTAAAAAAAAAAAPYNGDIAAKLMPAAACGFNAPAAPAAPAPLYGQSAVASTEAYWQIPTQQQQQLLQQPMCASHLDVAPAGFSSPGRFNGSGSGSGSYSSSDAMDPAVLELEQFMMQELAAAGVVVNDSSSATPLPTVAGVAAPAQAHPCWHHAPVPSQQPMQQQQQQQAIQQQQPCGAFAPAQMNWHNAAACDAAPSAAVRSNVHDAVGWVPAGACGSSILPATATSPQQQQQQQGMMRASPGPAPGCGGSAAAAAAAAVSCRGLGSRSEMMARLQGRLHVLQSQMEDMQLMLGLLQDR